MLKPGRSRQESWNFLLILLLRHPIPLSQYPKFHTIIWTTRNRTLLKASWIWLHMNMVSTARGYFAKYEKARFENAREKFPLQYNNYLGDYSGVVRTTWHLWRYRRERNWLRREATIPMQVKGVVDDSLIWLDVILVVSWKLLQFQVKGLVGCRQ